MSALAAIRQSVTQPAGTIAGRSLAATCTRAAIRWPALDRRLHNAAVLLASGAIHSCGLPHAYAVQSQRWADRSYRVDTQLMECECYDRAHLAPIVVGQPICKHLLGCLLAEYMSEPQKYEGRRLLPTA